MKPLLRPLTVSIAAIMGLSLTGCAGLNSSFDCPMKPGVMCENLDQVNTQVNQGALGSNGDCPSCHGGTASSAAMPVNSNFNTPYPMAGINPGDPVRYGETVMRVWFAPYQDKDGNYYQPNIVYAVVKPGHWIGQPAKAVTNDGDGA